MDVDIFQRFAALKAEEEDLDRQLKEKKAERETLEPRILHELSQSGLARVPLATGYTVYQERKLWANAAVPEGAEKGDYDAACDGLEAAGLGEFIQRRFDTNSVSAYFREREREEEERQRQQGVEQPVVEPDDLIPDELKGRIVIREDFKAKAVKS